MRVTLNGQVISGGASARRFSKSWASGLNDSRDTAGKLVRGVLQSEKTYFVTERRMERLGAELAEEVDEALEDYFKRLAHLILVQGRGAPYLSGHPRFGIPTYSPLRDSYLKLKNRMARRGKVGRRVSGFLKANPHLARPGAYYAFTGRTHQTLLRANTRTKFGKTSWSFDRRDFRGSVSQIKKMLGPSTFSGVEAGVLLGTLTLKIAPRIPVGEFDRLTGAGQDSLGRHLFPTRRLAPIMGSNRRLASPVFDYYLRVTIPSALNKFMRRRGQTLLYNKE